MTRLLQKPGAMQSEIELRINQAYDRLKEKSDEELNSKLIEGFNYCKMKDGLEDKPGNWNLVVASPILYEGIAAQRILNKKHGFKYCQEIIGYRLPKTFMEKFIYYFTGKLPES